MCLVLSLLKKTGAASGSISCIQVPEEREVGQKRGETFIHKLLQATYPPFTITSSQLTGKTDRISVIPSLIN